MKRLATIFAAGMMLGSVWLVQADKKLPVQWTFEPQTAPVAPSGKFTGKLTAKIDPTWHMYSVSTPKGGGLPTIIKIDDPAVADLKVYQPKPDKKFDPNFGVDTERYEGEVVFLVEAELAKTATPGALEVPVSIRFSACTDKECLPPRKVTATGKINVDAKAPESAALVLPAGYMEAKLATTAATASTPSTPNPQPAPTAQ